MSKTFTAIGLMSGTSMDGIDLAIIRTDGEEVIERGNLHACHAEYFTPDRRVIEKAINEAAELEARDARPGWLKTAEDMITQKHIARVRHMLDSYRGNPQYGLAPPEIDVIGFHGQTVLHRPDKGLTVQLGDGQALADAVGFPVVNDMRAADIAAGGQGAPLVPVYHRALVKQAGLDLPVAVVNVGGVANVTYIGEDGELLAFDTGPGNALLNDWVVQHGAGEMDRDGEFAAAGKVKESVLSKLLNNPYFSQDPPKSLDRNHFSLEPLEGMSLEWGAKTLTSFTALATSRADFFFPVATKSNGLFVAEGCTIPPLWPNLKSALMAM